MAAETRRSAVVGCINIHLGRIYKRKMLLKLLIDRKVDICVVSETRFLKGRGKEAMEEAFGEKFEWFGREKKNQGSKGGRGV